MTIAIRRHAVSALVAAAVAVSLGAETRAANELCGQTITESITFTADQSCIDDGLIVGADGITIDLGGFTLSGDGGASDDGIDVNGHAKVTIRNGTVRNFQRGITSTAGIAPQKLKISRMTLRYNVDGGALTVESGVIEQSAFSNNTDVGLDIGISSGKITATSFVANGSDGLTLFAGKVVVTNVIASGNVGSGIHVMPGRGLAIQSSTCVDNVVNGILVEGPYDPIKVMKNTLVGNGANGVAFVSAGSAGGGNKISGNFIAGNGASGVALAGFAEGNLLVGNRLVGNDHDGVTIDSTSSANVVKRNTAIGNGGEGFSIGHASTVVAGNVGNANHDRGILAIGGAVDGGGNKGRANGGPPCSAGIACAPAFTPKPGPSTVTCGMTVTTSITLGADTFCIASTGLVVQADDITIDLNGHTLHGDRTQSTAGVLILARKNVTIKNGIIQGFGQNIGTTFPTDGLKLVNVEIRDARSLGAFLNGSGAVITNSVFVDNSGDGLEIVISPPSLRLAVLSPRTLTPAAGAKISATYFVQNDGFGVRYVAPGLATLTNVTSTLNSDAGIRLDGAGTASIRGSTIAANQTDGIRAGGLVGATAPPTFASNVVVGNGLDGIALAANGVGTTVAANLAGGNGSRGIAVTNLPDQTVAKKNVLVGNGGDGLFVDTSVTTIAVAQNTAVGNGNVGVNVDSTAATLTKNVGVANVGYGIGTPFGAIDGGGNKARDNAAPTECAGTVVCN